MRSMFSATSLKEIVLLPFCDQFCACLLKMNPNLYWYHTSVLIASLYRFYNYGNKAFSVQALLLRLDADYIGSYVIVGQPCYLSEVNRVFCQEIPLFIWSCRKSCHFACGLVHELIKIWVGD